jgi:drug/metabolite transporter (DMT)-like permease
MAALWVKARKAFAGAALAFVTVLLASWGEAGEVDWQGALFAAIAAVLAGVGVYVVPNGPRRSAAGADTGRPVTGTEPT